jgi:halocyanin-like protein
MTRPDGYSRRGVLRAAAGSAAALGVGAAATGTAAAQDYGGWFTGDAKGGAVGNYDGSTTDMTGQDEVTITVGSDANGGSFGFGPAAVRVSPGTTVTFEWASNTHNVLVEEQPDGADWGGHEPIENSGFSFSHTFETEGVYTYYCKPHLTMGMKGAIVVGGGSGGGGGGGGVPAEFGGWFTGDAKGGAVGNYDGTTVNRTGQDSVTVTVGSDANGGSFGFGPAAVRVSPGTEVTFEWASNTHNVLVEEQPDGADWGGHEPIENSGFSFSHTFETEGVYTYYCKPHLTMGMKGAIVVGSAPGGGGGGGGSGPTGQVATPGSGLWKSVFASGVLLAMVAPVVANYYRRRSPPGVEYEPDTDEQRDERTETPEADAYEPAEEIGHDEYDPVGTAALVLAYFLILVGMWVFMYFVEFLGNGPTIVG